MNRVNQFPNEDAEVMGIQLQWKVEVPSELKTGFAELLQKLVTTIGPGDSLKEVRVIADDALASEILSLTGELYQPGSYYPEGVTVPIEEESTFSSTILIRQAFFASSETISGEKASFEQVSTLVEELYHCCLYHLAWQYRDIFQSTPSMRKYAMLRTAYRFIFDPLARHTGFLAPIPPDYPLQASNNDPEENLFYREVIAPFWIPIKSSLEATFDSQFSRTEEALQAMSEMVDACLDRLRQEL